jgi:hypothetical protein
MKSSNHWYSQDGKPCYETPYKDPAKGMRSTTLADARKLNLLPSVTTITKVLAAPSLIEWLRREAAIAVATTPRRPDEPLDDFVERCLSVDAEDTADKAKQLGSDIHDAIEKVLSGKMHFVDEPFNLNFLQPACTVVAKAGHVTAAEKILVGDGYAGKTDCIAENDEAITVFDFKTTGAKVLPKKSYFEHLMQTAAYAKTLRNVGNKQIRTANIYISTTRPGEISVCTQDDWDKSFRAFELCKELWQIQNNYHPTPTPADDHEGLIP